MNKCGLFTVVLQPSPCLKVISSRSAGLPKLFLGKLGKLRPPGGYPVPSVVSLEEGGVGNGRKIHFMINLHRPFEARLGFELATLDSAVNSDCAMELSG